MDKSLVSCFFIGPRCISMHALDTADPLYLAAKLNKQCLITDKRHVIRTFLKVHFDGIFTFEVFTT